MTKKEKMYPKIMNASRKNRVAKGAGVTVQDINKLLKQFLEMQKMMKKVSNLDERNLRKFENMIDNKYKNNIS
jgi:signal recognition particle subunit SRP54